MSSKQLIRQKLYSNKTFYEPKDISQPVTTQRYEKMQHQRPDQHYQQKKKSTFTAHHYSSSWNPLYKKRSRVDPPYKELYERKQRVPQFSDKKTDPFSVKTPHNTKQTKQIKSSRPQYQPSREYKIQHELRYVLPKNRQLSQPNKQYVNQIGMNVQPPLGTSRKQKTRHVRNNSSLMKLSLDYSMSKDGLNHNKSMFITSKEY